MDKKRALGTFPVRPEKDQVFLFLRQMAPQYLEMFRELQTPEGWRKFAEGFAELSKRLKLDGYVMLYITPLHLHVALAIGLMGLEEFKTLDRELSKASVEEQQVELNKLMTEATSDNSAFDKLFPNSLEEQEKITATINELPISEQREIVKRGQFLYAGVFGLLFNCISLMVNGEALTSLVQKAIAGNKRAFLKAIHVDKTILHAHPKFRERYEQALQRQESDFLQRVGYHLQASPTLGKIQYPGHYFVFAILEGLGWLNELRHREILALCDSMDLDRWQPPISDVTALTKLLCDYRRNHRS